MTMHSNFDGGWTDVRVAMLREMRGRNLSAGEIANELGGVSRSAVIGKLYRLSVPYVERQKLSPEEKLRRRRERRNKQGNYSHVVRHIEAVREKKREPTPPPRKQTPAERFAAAHIEREKIAHMAANELTDLPPEDAAAAVRFDQLTGNTCRWPLGDPHSLETIRFCGKDIATQSYCAHHWRVAHK